VIKNNSSNNFPKNTCKGSLILFSFEKLHSCLFNSDFSIRIRQFRQLVSLQTWHFNNESCLWGESFFTKNPLQLGLKQWNRFFIDRILSLSFLNKNFSNEALSKMCLMSLSSIEPVQSAGHLISTTFSKWFIYSRRHFLVI